MRTSSPVLDRAEIERVLREEVLVCHAPVSGVFVASAIVTEKAVYFEHNYERENPTVFEHSETRSLDCILAHETSPKIKMIMLAGGGAANKFKSYVPCYTCATALSPYVSEQTEIVLLELSGLNKGLQFSYKELEDAYKSLPFSEIESLELEEITKEIAEKTELKGADLECISAFTRFGKEKGIGIYLTGSSTKRGGAGTLLNSKSGDKYRDIDVLFITRDGTDDLEKHIEDTIIARYGTFSRRLREIPPIHNPKGVVFKKYIYTHAERMLKQ